MPADGIGIRDTSGRSTRRFVSAIRTMTFFCTFLSISRTRPPTLHHAAGAEEGPATIIRLATAENIVRCYSYFVRVNVIPQVLRHRHLSVEVAHLAVFTVPETGVYRGRRLPAFGFERLGVREVDHSGTITPIVVIAVVSSPPGCFLVALHVPKFRNRARPF